MNNIILKHTTEAINKYEALIDDWNNYQKLTGDELNYVDYFYGELAKAIVIDSGDKNSLELMRHLAAYLRITDKELLEELRK